MNTTSKGESMKRLIPIFILFAMMMFACSLPFTDTPPEPPPATEPPVIEPLVTEPPVIGEPPMTTNSGCDALTVYIDPGFAGSYSCEVVPEQSEGMVVYPSYTSLSMQYAGITTTYTGHIDLLPIARYEELMPGFISSMVAELQSLTSGTTPGVNLPALPVLNGGQEFTAQYQVLSFGSGNGIRYLTMYVQMQVPVNNQMMIYSFQGLTSDGQYWVAGTFQVAHPSLPENGDNPPPGQTWDQFYASLDTYLADITSVLNSSSADTFQPSLYVLDAMMGSIAVAP
jgi:hypothetical protein